MTSGCSKSQDCIPWPVRYLWVKAIWVNNVEGRPRWAKQVFNVPSKTWNAKKVTQRYRKESWRLHIASDATVAGQGYHMGTIPLPVCVISIICYNMHLLWVSAYVIFLQKSLDCNCVTAEAWENTCIRLRWFSVEHIRKIRMHPKHVSKIVILYIYFWIYCIGHHAKSSRYK